MASRKIALLTCGSYNPPHFMHLRMFEIAKTFLEETSNYRVMAGYISPVSDGYRKKGLVPIHHRFEMCRRATSTSNWISLSEWEGLNPEWTPTAESVKYHAEKARTDLQADLKLLIGADCLVGFAIPGLWAESDIELILKHGVICVERPGSDCRDVISNHSILSKWKENIIIIKSEVTNDISSTLLRGYLREQKSIKYLTHDLVVDYLNEKSIYDLDSEERNKDVELAPMTKGYK